MSVFIYSSPFLWILRKTDPVSCAGDPLLRSPQCRRVMTLLIWNKKRYPDFWESLNFCELGGLLNKLGGLESERLSLVRTKGACWFGIQNASKLKWLKEASKFGVVGWLVWFWLTVKGIHSFEVCPSFPIPWQFCCCAKRAIITMKNIWNNMTKTVIFHHPRNRVAWINHEFQSLPWLKPLSGTWLVVLPASPRCTQVHCKNSLLPPAPCLWSLGGVKPYLSLWCCL